MVNHLNVLTVISYLLSVSACKNDLTFKWDSHDIWGKLLRAGPVRGDRLFLVSCLFAGEDWKTDSSLWIPTKVASTQLLEGSFVLCAD